MQADTGRHWLHLHLYLITGPWWRGSGWRTLEHTGQLSLMAGDMAQTQTHPASTVHIRRRTCTWCLQLFSPWPNSWPKERRGGYWSSSFLRLIIHSAASSCYRCPALHPCSSHWRITLKKALLTFLCPEEGRKEGMGQGSSLATSALQLFTTYVTQSNTKDVQIQTDKSGE